MVAGNVGKWWTLVKDHMFQTVEITWSKSLFSNLSFANSVFDLESVWCQQGGIYLIWSPQVHSVCVHRSPPLSFKCFLRGSHVQDSWSKYRVSFKGEELSWFASDRRWTGGLHQSPFFSTVNHASNSSRVTGCHRSSCVTCLPNLKRVSLFSRIQG